MNLPISVTQSDLLEILLNVATVHSVFIWGVPGIRKSALVEKLADEVGLQCLLFHGMLHLRNGLTIWLKRCFQCIAADVYVSSVLSLI